MSDSYLAPSKLFVIPNRDEGPVRNPVSLTPSSPPAHSIPWPDSHVGFLPRTIQALCHSEPGRRRGEEPGFPDTFITASALHPLARFPCRILTSHHPSSLSFRTGPKAR